MRHSFSCNVSAPIKLFILYCTMFYARNIPVHNHNLFGIMKDGFCSRYSQNESAHLQGVTNSVILGVLLPPTFHCLHYHMQNSTTKEKLGLKPNPLSLHLGRSSNNRFGLQAFSMASITREIPYFRRLVEFSS